MSDFRAIAIAAEVAEVKLFQICVDDLFENIRRGVIGEMAVAAEDALLQAPWTTRVFL